MLQSPELCIKLVPENDQEKYVQRRKLELLEAADKMHTLLWRKPPVSKFCVELEWLRNVLQATLTEVPVRLQITSSQIATEINFSQLKLKCHPCMKTYASDRGFRNLHDAVKGL